MSLQLPQSTTPRARRLDAWNQPAKLLNQHQVRSYAKYVDELQEVLADGLRGGPPDLIISRIDDALNRGPAERLRELVGRPALRRSGAFFSGPVLAASVAAQVAPSLNKTSVIYDPACGGGDLLISCAQQIANRLSPRLASAQLARCIAGRDVHGEFIEVSKLRLKLLVLRKLLVAKSGSRFVGSLDFPMLSVGSGLADFEPIRNATHIVLNPPFISTTAPPDCAWRSGRVNSAALFLETCIKESQPGTRIVALLPEVLRSGSSYDRWRSMVLGAYSIDRVEVIGRFSSHADVDVFIWAGTKRRAKAVPRRSPTTRSPSASKLSVGRFFTVRVGPVVDYRSPRTGPDRRYLHARNADAWAEIRRIGSRRRWNGALVNFSFVVVRRTSRPGKLARAEASLVTSGLPVAVENHLIVLEPRRGSLRQCRHLMRILGNPRTDRWLDRQIRCRHLTTAALKSLPWWDLVSPKRVPRGR